MTLLETLHVYGFFSGLLGEHYCYSEISLATTQCKSDETAGLRDMAIFYHRARVRPFSFVITDGSESRSLNDPVVGCGLPLITSALQLLSSYPFHHEKTNQFKPPKNIYLHLWFCLRR